MLCMSEVSKEYTHIFAHNFLNIQWIFNWKKVLKSWDLGHSNHTIKCYVCWRCQKWLKINKSCNAMYVKRTCTHIFAHNFLNIQQIVWTKDQRVCRRCQRWCMQLYREMLLMSEVSKVNSFMYYVLWTKDQRVCRRCWKFCTHTLIEWSHCHSMYTEISSLDLHCRS